MKMSAVIVLIIAAIAVAVELALAWVPMQLLMAHITRNVQQFIERQRERRRAPRDGHDRRKVAP